MAEERRAADPCYYSAAPIGSNWTWSIAVVAGESTAEIWVMKKVRWWLSRSLGAWPGYRWAVARGSRRRRTVTGRIYTGQAAAAGMSARGTPRGDTGSGDAADTLTLCCAVLAGMGTGAGGGGREEGRVIIDVAMACGLEQGGMGGKESGELKCC